MRIKQSVGSYPTPRRTVTADISTRSENAETYAHCIRQNIVIFVVAIQKRIQLTKTKEYHKWNMHVILKTIMHLNAKNIFKSLNMEPNLAIFCDKLYAAQFRTTVYCM